MREARGRQARRTFLPVLVLLLLALASCKEGTFYEALGDHVAKAPLGIAPATGTIPNGSSLTFSTTGGMPPYIYSIVSGPGTIDGSTGVYTSSGGGAVVVRVTDNNGKTSDAAITVTTTGMPNVDYTVSSVTVTGPYLAGNSINASFALENVGNANGSQGVSWSAYVSTDNSLGGGDTLVASGTASHLDSGASSVVPVTPVTGTWPAAIGGTYFLVVSVSALDDTGPTANVGASGGCLLAAPTVNYVVSAVAAPGGPGLPAGTLTSSFQLSNTGANNGSQLVSWSAYASLTTTIDGSSLLVASGVSQPLATGAGAVVIPINGQWPLHYGAYHLVVSASASADVESNASDNVAATAGTTAVGMINEAEPNDDAVALLPAGVQDLGITLRPGMSVLVTRSAAGADIDDVFAFNTGSAASVSLFMSWGSAGSQNVTLRFKKDAPVATLISANAAAGTSLSLSWTVDSAQTARWIDANNAAGETAYTLIITGN